jgi:D-alanyl-D-alanine carboxypeptidase (penicillin-binding protein 5/6)
MRALLIIFTILSFASSSFAAKKNMRKSCIKAKHSVIQTALIVDAESGKVLYSENATKLIYPASLTKMMTLYMLFEAIESGKLSMEQKLYVSKNASNMLPCKLGLKAGERITVRDAILGLIVKSANDVAVAVAENIAGSEDKFAQLMTRKAKVLGMHNTSFSNASGWHHSELKTTAIDLAKLAIALKRDYPTFYPFFSRTNFKFRDKNVIGHNAVTAEYPGAEGLKTGYTSKAGYNLVTVAMRNGKRLIGVITGSRSSKERNKKMTMLLNKYFGIQSDNTNLKTNCQKK